MVDAATLEKLEAGFAKLQAATDCKSLLRKYLTKEVFDALKNKKTSFGSTLLDVIQSGKSSSSCQVPSVNRVFFLIETLYLFFSCLLLSNINKI